MLNFALAKENQAFELTACGCVSHPREQRGAELLSKNFTLNEFGSRLDWLNVLKKLLVQRLARILLGLGACVQPGTPGKEEKIMPDEGNIRETNATSRREVVKKSAQVAVTAPAVALLLNASTKPVFAQPIGASSASAHHILDDFTFGNNEEDIDAIKLHNNFNPQNHGAQLDDHV